MPKFILGALFLIILAVILVKSPLLAGNPLQKLSLSTPLGKKSAEEIATKAANEKKNKLDIFYMELRTVVEKHDWSKLYDLSAQSLKNNVTRDQFIAFATADSKKSKFVSEQTIVHSIVVDGDKGIVDRTIVTCITKECAGDDRKENSAKINYEYVNGKWQSPDPEPSERGLKAANYAYDASSENDKQDIIKMFGYGSTSSVYSVRNWALYLDGNLGEMVRVETLIENNKAEKSRPVYYQQPAQIIQQNPSSVHCTSLDLGTIISTNCN